MKKLKKLLSLVLCGLMSVSVVGCGGGEGPGDGDGGATGNPTKVDITIYDAGVSKQWLVDLAKKYEQENKDVSFRDGETGVYFNVQGISSNNLTSNSSEHIFVAHNTEQTGKELANKGLIVNIDDILTEKIDDRDGDGVLDTSIKDKIDPIYYDRVCSEQGQGYAIPSYGLTTGFTIDVYQFKSKGFFLAHPSTWNNPDASYHHVSQRYGVDAYFILGSGGKDFHPEAVLSVGPDGVPDTSDDGMPTSLEEFIAMCDYMANFNSVKPFLSYKESKKTEVLDNFWASLSGYDQFQARYTYGERPAFDGWPADQDNEDGGVYIDVVTSVNTSKPLFNTTYIFEPVVERVKITRANAHIAEQSVGRYYACAMLAMFDREEWYVEFAEEPTHLEGEEFFVMNTDANQTECAMLVEGNYWFNESKKAGSLEKFNKMIGIPEDRTLDLAWMHLPVMVTGTITGVGEAYTKTTDLTTKKAADHWDAPIVRKDGTANQHVENNSYGASIYINSRYQNDTKLIALLKDFLQWLHTDEHLSYYTGTEGVFRAAMSYEVSSKDMARLADIQKDTVYAQLAAERPVSPARDAEVFNAKTHYAFSDPNQGTEVGYAPSNCETMSVWDLFYNTIKPVS